MCARKRCGKWMLPCTQIFRIDKSSNLNGHWVISALPTVWTSFLRVRWCEVSHRWRKLAGWKRSAASGWLGVVHLGPRASVGYKTGLRGRGMTQNDKARQMSSVVFVKPSRREIFGAGCCFSSRCFAFYIQQQLYCFILFWGFSACNQVVDADSFFSNSWHRLPGFFGEVDFSNSRRCPFLRERCRFFSAAFPHKRSFSNQQKYHRDKDGMRGLPWISAGTGSSPRTAMCGGQAVNNNWGYGARFMLVIFPKWWFSHQFLYVYQRVSHEYPIESL